MPIPRLDMPPPAHPAIARQPRSPRGDAGFSLVELLVVLVLVAVVVAVAVRSLHSTNRVGLSKAAINAAQQYSEAIDTFAADHQQRVPATIGDARDWPAPIADGPVKRLDSSTVTRYLHGGPPERVSNGDIALTNGTGAAPGAGTRRAVIAYRAGTDSFGAATRYELRVYVEDAYVCSLGTDVATSCQ